jgi:hypothetical protein
MNMKSLEKYPNFISFVSSVVILLHGNVGLPKGYQFFLYTL